MERRITLRQRVQRLGLALGAPMTLASPLLAQGFSLDARIGYLDVTNARDSAKAVLGTPGGLTVGVGGNFFLGRRFSLGGSIGYFQKTGERVFVADASSPVFRLGHPLTVRIIPAHAVGQYRFPPKRRPFASYVGLGLGFTGYHEKSEIAGISETSSATKPSGKVLAGVEYGRGRLRYGLEASYSMVPNAIGVGGVSKVYDESDIGGFTVLGRLIWKSSPRPRAPRPPPSRR